MVRGELNFGYQGEGGDGEVQQTGVKGEGGVQLQRKLGLASGISLIVGWCYNAFLYLNLHSHCDGKSTPCLSYQVLTKLQTKDKSPFYSYVVTS